MKLQSLFLLFVMLFSFATFAEPTIETTSLENPQITSEFKQPADFLDQPKTQYLAGIFQENNNQLSASSECCKVCRKGKACGDSCISKSKTCNVGAGCACDG